MLLTLDMATQGSKAKEEELQKELEKVKSKLKMKLQQQVDIAPGKVNLQVRRRRRIPFTSMHYI